MTVTVHMHGNLRRFMPRGEDQAAVEVTPGTTVATWLCSVGAERDIWLVAVNGVTAERDHVLGPGDVLDCFEPVAAG
jgi:sulfur carrier protein ThiS